MDRLARLAVVAAAAWLAAACGDPVVVLGDRPGILRVVAGVPDSMGTSLDSTATASWLHTPRGITVSPDGRLFIAEGRTKRVLSVGLAGDIDVIADELFCSEEPCLGRPTDIARTPDGMLLVPDGYDGRVWLLDPATGALEVLVGTGEEASSPDGTPTWRAALRWPAGVAAGPDGSVYISEAFAHRVRSIEDGALITVAGTGTRGYRGDGGPAAEARLENPRGMAVHDGVLYIADTGNDVVRAVDLDDGTIRTVAGSGERGYGGDGLSARAASLAAPRGVAVSDDGRALFIADTDNHRIRRVDLQTGIITTFAGTGGTEFNGDVLPAGESALARPFDVGASDDGFLYIADTDHHVIRRTLITF